MNNFLAAIEESIEFQNPEYLNVLAIAVLFLLFGLGIFGLRLGLRPAKTHGSFLSPLWTHQVLVSGDRCARHTVCCRGSAVFDLWRLKFQAQ